MILVGAKYPCDHLHRYKELCTRAGKDRYEGRRKQADARAAPTSPIIWPTPEDLFTWFGEANVSRDPQDATKVTAVLATAMHHGYLQWHNMHKEASLKIDEMRADLQDAFQEPDRAALRKKVKQRRSGLSFFHLCFLGASYSFRCPDGGARALPPSPLLGASRTGAGRQTGNRLKSAPP